MFRTPIQDIEQRLKDPEYAKIFGAEDAKSEFAITLARARDRAGLTQKELAEKLGVSQAYIAKLEGGEANPTLGAIGSMLAMLGLSVVMDVKPLLPYEAAPAREPAGQLAIADSSQALKGNCYSVRVRKSPH